MRQSDSLDSHVLARGLSDPSDSSGLLLAGTSGQECPSYTRAAEGKKLLLVTVLFGRLPVLP